MSVSPPKDGADTGDAPSENSEMERGEEAQAREAYDFEVKEQDRWLPIANGRCLRHAPVFLRVRFSVFARMSP